jgi:hypothetical protein
MTDEYLNQRLDMLESKIDLFSIQMSTMIKFIQMR